MRIDAAKLPAIVGHGEGRGGRCRRRTSRKQSASKASSQRTGDLPLTADQRRMLFGIGKSKGLDIDDLRAMTPTGSISALSRTEAGRLIDRLLDKAGWSDLHGGNGTATGKQLGLIAHLRDQLGFAAGEFERWLRWQWKIESIEEIADRDLASRVIGGLLAMQRNRSRRPASASGR